MLNWCYGPIVTRIVREPAAEHHALDTDRPIVSHDDPLTLLAGTADKIVALTSLTRRARRSGDPVAFFTGRPVLRRLLAHFRRVHGRRIGPAVRAVGLASQQQLSL